MVKKIILNLFFLLIFAVIIFFAFLSTIGIETNRFNKVIIDKIAETNNIDVDLKTIKFKLDLKDLSLYLETNKPVIVYKKIVIPSNDVKVYLDFLSLIKTNLKIQKISIDFEEIDIKQINKLSKIIKPSNFKLEKNISSISLFKKFSLIFFKGFIFPLSTFPRAR